MTRSRALRGALGALLLLPVTGCQSAQTSAAHKIADALTHSLGPADHYEVQVEGDTFALARGRARRIHVTGVQVHVEPDATLDTLDIDARDVSFDPETRRIEHAGSVTFQGTVGQENLDRYLADRQPLVPGLAVQLRSRDVLARIPVTVAGVHTAASISGTLAPDAAQPDHLDFAADGASLGLLPIPVRLVNMALHAANPVFGFSQIKVPVTLTGANVSNAQVVLQGTANLDNFQQ